MAEAPDETTALTPPDASPSCVERLEAFREKLVARAKNFDFSTQRRLAFVAASWGFLTGVERAIILPTLWLYFFRYFSAEAAVQYYGASLAAFNLAVLICSPLYGLLASRGFSVKVLLLVSNQFEIIGNVIYFLASAPWLVMFGRFVAGIGAGSEVPLYSDIVRSTKRRERTAFLLLLLLLRQFGLIIGPACSLMMHPIKFDVGQRHFDVYNLPGLFMAILWSIHTITTVAIYPLEVPVAEPTKERDPNDPRTPEEEVRKEQNPYTQPNSVTALFVIFSIYLSLMAFEAVLSPVADTNFGWTDLETSIVYMLAGLTVIAVFGVLVFLSKKHEDRKLTVIGLIVLVITYTYFTIICIPLRKGMSQVFVPLILMGIPGHVFGLPFCDCAESLYTKVVPVEDVDRAQIILRTVINVAIMVGPYIGGLLQFVPWAVFLIMTIFVAISLCLFIRHYEAFSPENIYQDLGEDEEEGKKEDKEDKAEEEVERTEGEDEGVESEDSPQ